MAGTIRGLIEQYANEADEYQNGSIFFVNLYNFLNAHPQTTLVALQYGLGGTGMDYFDGAAPHGNNSFAVFRFNPTANRAYPFYVLIQTNGPTIDAMGDAPGNPALSEGTSSTSSCYVSVQMAIGEGGDENPWNGTANADGTDTKGVAVWKVPSGGTRVHVFPRSNAPGGSHATNMENMIPYWDQGSPAPNRVNVWADDDNLWWAVDEGDTNDWDVGGLFNIIPHPGLASLPIHTCMFNMSSSMSGLAEYETKGNTTGSGNETGGGVIPVDTSRGVRIIGLKSDNFHPDVNHQPNPQTGDLDRGKIIVVVDEAPDYGALGTLERASEVFNVVSTEVNVAADLVYLGNGAVTAQRKWVFPWDGTTVPRSSVARAGISF